MQPHRDTFELCDLDYSEIAAMNRALSLGETYCDMYGHPDDAAWSRALRIEGIRHRAARRHAVERRAVVALCDAQMELLGYA